VDVELYEFVPEPLLIDLFVVTGGSGKDEEVVAVVLSPVLEALVELELATLLKVSAVLGLSVVLGPSPVLEVSPVLELSAVLNSAVPETSTELETAWLPPTLVSIKPILLTPGGIFPLNIAFTRPCGVKAKIACEPTNIGCCQSNHDPRLKDPAIEFAVSKAWDFEANVMDSTLTSVKYVPSGAPLMVNSFPFDS